MAPQVLVFSFQNFNVVLLFEALNSGERQPNVEREHMHYLVSLLPPLFGLDPCAIRALPDIGRSAFQKGLGEQTKFELKF